jgi:hypothetical protein
MDWRKQILQENFNIRIGIACQYQSGNFSDVFAYFRGQQDAAAALRCSDKHPFYVRFSRGQRLRHRVPCLREVFQVFDSRRQGPRASLTAGTGTSEKTKGCLCSNLQATDCIDLAWLFAILCLQSSTRTDPYFMVFSLSLWMSLGVLATGTRVAPATTYDKAVFRHDVDQVAQARTTVIPRNPFRPFLFSPVHDCSRQLSLGRNLRWIRVSVLC